MTSKSKTPLKTLYSIDYQLNAYLIGKNDYLFTACIYYNTRKYFHFYFAMWKIIANIVKSIRRLMYKNKKYNYAPYPTAMAFMHIGFAFGMGV